MILRPFWRYYGAKWRAARNYDAPRHRTLVEPFAGAAGYALHYPESDVILVDCYPIVAGIWKWLIEVSEEEVMSIPLVDSVDDLPEWVARPARSLIGFAMNAATAAPRRSVSSGGLTLRAAGRKFYGWTKEYRERVATQVQHIRHWRVIEGSYRVAPSIEATWFIDPPYQLAGRHYVHGSSDIDYADLATYCRERQGQVIVCEQDGATWLPFRSIGNIKSGPRSRMSAEAVWP